MNQTQLADRITSVDHGLVTVRLRLVTVISDLRSARQSPSLDDWQADLQGALVRLDSIRIELGQLGERIRRTCPAGSRAALQEATQ